MWGLVDLLNWGCIGWSVGIIAESESDIGYGMEVLALGSSNGVGAGIETAELGASNDNGIEVSLELEWSWVVEESEGEPKPVVQGTSEVA